MTGFEEVVVTAQFSPKRIDQSIYKVKVIDNSVVENKGATNLSELISNELINWTLSDQYRRADIRVGVAYGTDPETVMALLLKGKGKPASSTG